MHTDPRHIDIWLQHIRALAEDIGPRGSTTEAERRASQYCEQVLAKLGLAPQIESFTSATTMFGYHLTVGLYVLAAFAIYPLAGRVSAATSLVLAFTAIYSEIRELRYLNNPVRRVIPKAPSQNVIATVEPSDEHQQDLILIGHVDTNRCSILFRNPHWVDFWRVAGSLIFFSFLIQVFIYTAGLITQAAIIWPTLSLQSLFFALALVAFMLEGELAPFSAGANDNATAAGLVLSLAERFSAEPLRHTRVWCVCTGCEEVKHYGAIDFFRRHHTEFVNPKALVFEMLGRDGPGYLVFERSVSIFRFNASAEMVSLAEQITASCPELGAHPTWVDGGHTEMADAIRVGVPAITLIGLYEQGSKWNYDGPTLYWHHREDTVDKMIPEVLDRNYAFAWAFIQALDAEATRTPMSESTLAPTVV